MHKIKLIYILGRAFTGSTLLEMILDVHSKVMSTGEMIYLKRIYENRNKIQCSCLKNAGECNLWSEVLSNYHQKFKNKYQKNIFELSPKKSYIKLILHQNELFTQNELSEYREKNQFLFNELRQKTGKNIFVDSSKDPMRLYLLKKIGLFNIKIIYLYRDGRASIDSFKKRNRQSYNIFSRLLRVVGGEYIMRNMLRQKFDREEYFGLKYEDLTTNFHQEIKALLEFLDLKDEESIFTDKSRNDYFIHQINEHNSHIVGGNIYRLQKVTEIKNYENWRKNLNYQEKFLFSLLGGKITNRAMNKFLH
jgi:hypothetical protein